MAPRSLQIVLASYFIIEFEIKLVQSYTPIQRQAELQKIMRAIFDDYYYLSLISAQKSNSIAILCYNLFVFPWFIMPVQ
jgi:hypothetical protein